MPPKAPVNFSKATLVAAATEVAEILDLVYKPKRNASMDAICMQVHEIVEGSDHNKIVDELSEASMEALIAFNIIDKFIDEDLYSEKLVAAIEGRSDNTVGMADPVQFDADKPAEEEKEEEEKEEAPGDTPEDEDERPVWKILEEKLNAEGDTMKKKKRKKLKKQIEELKIAHRDQLMDAHVERLEGKGKRKVTTKGKDGKPAEKKERKPRGTGAIGMIAKVLVDNPKEWMSPGAIHEKAQELLGKDFSAKTVTAQLGTGKTTPRITEEKGKPKFIEIKVRGDKPTEREYRFKAIAKGGLLDK